MVRLKVFSQILTKLFDGGFNSKVVRLKDSCGTTKANALSSFNSKVVRLKVEMIELEAIKPMLFQFQSGAVKRGESNPLSKSLFMFQFQSGAVKRKSCRNHPK